MLAIRHPARSATCAAALLTMLVGALCGGCSGELTSGGSASDPGNRAAGDGGERLPGEVPGEVLTDAGLAPGHDGTNPGQGPGVPGQPPSDSGLLPADSGQSPGLDPLPSVQDPGGDEVPPEAPTVTAAPRFNIGRGFYDAPVNLILSSATPEAQIRYTIDGSRPTPSAGTWGTQLEVRSSMVVRAVAYSDNLEPSEIVTHTYLFTDDIIRQGENAGGSPNADTSATRQWASTAMVQKIVNRNPGAMKASLEALPTLAVSAPAAAIFKAIATSSPFAGGTEVALELIYADGSAGFQVDCEARLAGQAGRIREKKAITFEFKGEYGPKTLNFPLLPGSHVRRFDQLRLRSGWQIPDRPQLLPWGDDLQIAMSGDGHHGMFVHLYINGGYFGMYSLVEVAKAGFGAAHFGGDKDAWSALRGHSSLVEALAPQAGDLSSAERYAAFARRLDIPQYIDLLLLYMYLNAPKLLSEPRVIANEARGIGYRIYIWDIEEGSTTPFGIDVNSVRPDDADGNPVPSPYIDHDLFNKLWASADFRLALADRVRRHLLDGGALTEGPAAATYSARVEEARSGYLAELARWSPLGGETSVFDERLWPLQPNEHGFESKAARMIQNWMPQRAKNLLAFLREGGLYPALDAPRLSQYRGTLRAGSTLTISGTGGTLLYTLDGTDPRIAGCGAVHRLAIAAQGSAKVTLDQTTHVKARVRQGNSWSALTEAVLSVAPDLDKLRITELMYHPPGSGDATAGGEPAIDGDVYEFVELENTGATALDLSGVYFSDGLTYRFGTPTVLEGGARLVLARDPVRFAERYPNVALHGSYAGALRNSGERVALSDPNGALITSVTFDDKGLWPATADGGGPSLVPSSLAANLDPDAPSSWRASAATGGSPGADDAASQSAATEPVQGPPGTKVVLGQLATFPPHENLRWDYAVGYHFEPTVDGRVTHLGGFFDGEKVVKLFDGVTGTLLASVTVRSDNQWRYEPLDEAVAVSANHPYTLAVYLAGSGGSYRRLDETFPQRVGDIRITSATYVFTGRDAELNPTYAPGADYPFLLGQPDLAFVRR